MCTGISGKESPFFSREVLSRDPAFPVPPQGDTRITRTEMRGAIPKKTPSIPTRSDDVSCDIPRDNPVTITAVQPLGEYPEPAPDRLIGVGDAARVRAPDKTFDQGRDLHSFLLAHLEVPDDIDGGAGGDERNAVDLLLGQFPVREFDDILVPHVPALDIGRNRESFLGCPGDPQDLDNVQGFSRVNMVDDGAIPDPPDQQAFVLCGFRCRHWSTCMSIAILTGTPFFDCSKYRACGDASTRGSISSTLGKGWRTIRCSFAPAKSSGVIR